MEPPPGDAEAPLLDYHYKEDDLGLHNRLAAAEMCQEAKTQLDLGLPVVLMGFLDFTVQIISVAFIGRLGATNLAGGAMGSSFANVFGFAVLEGLAGGMETSGGQAYGGGQSQMLGLILQRGQIVLTMFCIPIAVLWVQAASVLRSWGQDEEIAELAGQYALCLLPGLFCTALFLPVSKFLSVQGVTKPLAVVSGTVLIFHGPVCWLYIHVFDLGFVGAALANSTSNLLTLLLLVLFLKFERSGILNRTWPGWSLAAFHNMGPFLALAVPACGMTAVEWWVWEIVQLMAGWLPRPEIAVSAMSIGFQTVGICFMLPLGLGAAASIRVANELGSQRPGRTRLAVIVGMILSTISGVILLVVLLCIRNTWPRLLVSEPVVIRTIAEMIPIMGLSITGIALNAGLSGILRGSGQQLVGSLINISTLYGGAIPLAYVFGIHMQMGIQGLWLGMTVGVALQFIGQAFVTARTNWEYQARRAALTLSSNSGETAAKSLIY